MNLLLTDTPLQTVLPPDSHYWNVAHLQIKNCLGCFGCWVRTPGKCVLRDDAVKIYPQIAASSKVLYVTKVCFGSYDVPLKTMLERAIPIQQAFLRLHHGETHHVQRAVQEKQAVIIAYDCTDPQEQELFCRLIQRNAENMLFKSWQVRFVSREELEQAVQQEVDKWHSV